MDYIDKNTIMSSLNLTWGKLRHYIESGYFKDAKKINDSWHISKEDYCKLEEDISWINNSYDIPTVSKLFGYKSKSSSIITSKFHPEQYKYIFNKVYILKDAVELILEEELSEFTSSELENYSTINSIAKELNIKKSQISNLIANGTIKNYKKHPFNSTIYIHSNEICKLKEDVEFASNSYTLKDLCRLFNKNNTAFTVDMLEKYPHKNVFGVFYVEKNSINSLIQHEGNKIKAYEVITGTSSRFNINNENHRKFYLKTFNGKTYILIDYVSKELKLDLSSFKDLVLSDIYKDKILESESLYISQEEYNRILKIYNTSTPAIEVYNTILNKERLSIDNTIINKYFPNIFMFEYFGQRHYRIPNSDIEYFASTGIKQYELETRFKVEKDPYELFKIADMMIPENINIKQTRSYFKEFVFSKLSTSKSNKKREMVLVYKKTLEFISSFADKELYLCNNSELEHLFKEIIPTAERKQCISNFLNFLLNKPNIKCNYTAIFNSYFNIKEKTEEDIYTEQEWVDYLTFLIDIDTHIEKAFNDITYSKVWLYSLLHFSIAWRKEDIRKIPSLDFLNINEYNLNWFKDNLFTISDAQNIINNIKLFLDSSYINKSGLRNHFIIYPVLTIPTAIAFITIELHRRASNGLNLFGSTCFEYNDFVKCFGDSFSGFSNRKANRALLTYCFNEAVNKDGMLSIAYSLSTYLRAHKVNQIGLSEVTAQYIFNLNKDNNLNDVSVNLFKRGVFGWMYKSILNIISSTEELTLEEVTSEINNMKSELLPKNIEGLSRFIEFQSSERRYVIKELLSMDKSNLKDFLEKINKGQNLSKQAYTYCLKSQNCPYPTSKSCIWCKYSIPTNYTLMTINIELLSLLDKLDNSETSNLIERQRYTYQIVKLLGILNEAKKDFEIFEPNYFKSFLNLQEIQKKLQKVQANKFLMLK